VKNKVRNKYTTRQTTEPPGTLKMCPSEVNPSSSKKGFVSIPEYEE
jgi:hypothetical protein